MRMLLALDKNRLKRACILATPYSFSLLDSSATDNDVRRGAFSFEKEYSVESIVDKMRQNRLSWFGHVMR